MNSRQANHTSRAQKRNSGESLESPATAFCLQVVDTCLVGIVLVAPIFLGGRNPWGRFVFIVIACLAGVTWFTRQAMLKRAAWTRTWAHLIGLAALLIVILQLVPLPADVIAQLAPRARSLLPLWTVESVDSAQFGDWPTLSFTPSSTKIALATLIAYVLLFVTAAQRLKSLADIERLLRLIALSAILMSCFGLLQFFTSNGKFFWFYDHPFTTTDLVAKGTFSCRNHFAHFLALGTGPLLAWIVLRSQEQSQAKSDQESKIRLSDIALYLGLVLTVFAVLLSLSRGGAVALTIVSAFGLTIYYWRGLVTGSFLYCFAALGIVVIGMLSVYGHEKVADRLADFTSGSINELDRNSGRRKIWTANLAAVQQGGLFGAGAGSHKEIYPIYMPESTNKEYTHAENGPLQIATECGYMGVALLGLTLFSVGRWCWQAIRQALSVRQLAAAVAVSSGLIANVVQSLVDFAWFIPACMSLTILLASCALRLAQLSASDEVQVKTYAPWTRLRWVGLVIVSSIASAWAGSVVFGPARASTHWDRYIFTSKNQSGERIKQLNAIESTPAEKEYLNSLREMAIFNLTHVLAHDPDSARAHLRLAGRYLNLFDARQRDSDNAMSIAQIREAAISSRFPSAGELQRWLYQAFGENSKRLYQAYYHTRKSLQLCPLQGQGYLYMTDLCFLAGNGKEAVNAYLDQSLKVRPYDSQVLFEAGRQELLLGRADEALSKWQKIFLDPGSHQLNIVRLLAGQVSASLFIETFRPDWRTLSYVWRWYLHSGSPQDRQNIVRYAENFAETECADYDAARAVRVWRILASMQQALNEHERALSSLERALKRAPTDYVIRRQFGRILLKAEHYQRAEAHLAWCFSRKPNDTALHNELVRATKGSLSQTANIKDISR